ncbi:AraC family transcriptional regulator [Polaromonas sp. CT11-55]|uniref:AraC family transcriptional regulator n=1 Tax=Polaromonas sp. CT11-55 TaxID=3243045 RepID=UPI0039A47576
MNLDAEPARNDFSEWPDGPRLIALLGNDDQASEYRLGTREYGWHQHHRGQVFCVEAGLIHVQTAHGSWLLPPYRAGWMPPDVPHRVRVSGALTGWSLLVTPKASEQLPDSPCVIGISEVLRALVRRAAEWDKCSPLAPDQEHVVEVILDEIRRAPHESLHLPMPAHPRLERIARAILQEPGSARTLQAWADWGAMSPRTLRRQMLAETGLSFAQWRQQAQLTQALEMLARGESVTQVSDALGYASASNFIAMFRRAFGDSPARYFAARSAGNG